MSNILNEYTEAVLMPQESRSKIEHDREAKASFALQQDVKPIEGKDAFYDIKSERGEHRVICFLKAQGHSNIEIANKTGFHPVSISNILRQPRAKQLIAEEIARAGRDQIEVMLSSSAADSIQTLLEIRDSAKARASDRANAAKDLLDRFLGKPKQAIDITSRTDASQLSDAELAKIASQGQAN